MSFTPKTEAGWAAMASYAKTVRKAEKRREWMREWDDGTTPEIKKELKRGLLGSDDYWSTASYFYNIGLTVAQGIERLTIRKEKLK